MPKWESAYCKPTTNVKKKIKKIKECKQMGVQLPQM